MALSKGFRIFEKKQPNHSIILEHRQRTQEALLFESQAVAVLCKNISHSFLLIVWMDFNVNWRILLMCFFFYVLRFVLSSSAHFDVAWLCFVVFFVEYIFCVEALSILTTCYVINCMQFMKRLDQQYTNMSDESTFELLLC